MKTELIIKKDNALINAAYTLTLAEQRLILLAIAKASEKSEKLQATAIHASEYANRFNVSLRTAYDGLNAASNQLFERYFRYQKITEKGNVEHVKSRWVQRVSYIKKEGTIKIKFADDVLPLLCELKNRFTVYSFEAISNLSSVHAIRMYEIIIAWKSIGKTPVMSIEDLRLRLGIEPSEYKEMHNFKRRVLDASIKQINEHTDIIVSYEQFKDGRKIAGFSFSIKFKNPPIPVENARCSKTAEIDFNQPLTDKKLGYYAKLLLESSWASQAKILVGVESKDAINVIIRHLKRPEFFKRNKKLIDKLILDRKK